MNSDDLKLSRRIQNLVPWLVMLTLSLLVLVPAPAGAAPFAIGARVQVVNETINVRETPGGTLLGTQPVGSQGTVLAGPEVTPNGVIWYQIDYDSGVDGWSGQDNLADPTPDPTPPAHPTPPADPTPSFVIGARVQVLNETINVRESPGGTLLGTQPVGSQGTVVAGPEVTANGVIWYQIDYDSGVDGWSGQDRLALATPPKISPPETPPPPVTPPPPTFGIGARVQVVNTTINVRATPGGTLLGTQPVGRLGTVLAGPSVTPNGVIWYQIDYESGVDGWSGRDNLALAGDPTLPPPPPPPPTFGIGARVQVVNKTINVRATPGGTLLGTQPVGTLGRVLAGPTATSNGVIWYQIDYDSGVDGWSGQDNLDTFGGPSASADLALSLSDIPDLLTVGGRLNYTITVTNYGPGIARGIRVVDVLPPEALALQPLPPDSSRGECRGTVTVDCDLLPLAPGAAATVTINVIPRVVGDLSNTATVASETDPNPANNSETETTTVEPEDPARADLEITAVADVGRTPSDQGFAYRLTVKNHGPDTATGVQLTNDLPRGIDLDTASQANCSDTDPMLCPLGTLTSGEEATVTIDVIREVDADTLPNEAAVNLDQHDPNPDNNFALTNAVDLPTRQTTCDSKRCRLTLICNLSSLRSCDNQVTLFVDTRARRDTSARRLSERAARGPRLVRLAGTISNLPGGDTDIVQLKLAPKGKKLARTLIRQGKKKVRGVMEMRNHVGRDRGIDIIPLTVRLK